MTQEERTKICSTCKNRSFSIKEGLLCKKTMEKPSFEDSCSDYEVDAVEVSKQEQFNKELKESNGISGFLAFYVYWSIPIGILLTIISFFATPRSLQLYGYSLCLVLTDVVYYAIYLYLAIYTIYAFVKRKPDAVFMGKWCLAFVFVSNLLPIIMGTTGDSFLNSTSRILGSSIWSIVFFLYLTFSEAVKDYIPKETRRVSKLNKVIVALSIVLPILLLLGGIVEIAVSEGNIGLLASEKNKYESVCNQTKALLPVDVNDELTWVDMTMNENELEYIYKCKSISSEVELTEDYLEYIGKCQAEDVKAGLVDLMVTNKDKLFNDLAKSNRYGVRYTYTSPSNEDLYSIVVTNKELKGILETASYSTSTEAFESIIESYNKLLPIEYLQGCNLNICSLSDDGEVLHYHLQIVGLSKRDLVYMTHDYLKDYLTENLEYLTDVPTLIAKQKQIGLSFNFTADCSDTWSSSVYIKTK